MTTTSIVALHAVPGVGTTADTVALVGSPCPAAPILPPGVGAVRARVVRSADPADPALLALGWVRPPPAGQPWRPGDVAAARWDPGPYPAPQAQWRCAAFDPAIGLLSECEPPSQLVDLDGPSGPATIWLRPPDGADLGRMRVDGGAWCVRPDAPPQACAAFQPVAGSGLTLWQPDPTGLLEWRADGECDGGPACVVDGPPGPCGVTHQ